MSDNTTLDMILQGIGMGMALPSTLQMLLNTEKGSFLQMQRYVSISWLVTVVSVYVLSISQHYFGNQGVKLVSYFIFQYVIELCRVIVIYAQWLRNKEIVKPPPSIAKAILGLAIFTAATQAAISIYAGVFNFCIWLDSPCKANFNAPLHDILMQATDVELTIYTVGMDILFFIQFRKKLRAIGGTSLAIQSQARYQIGIYILSFFIGAMQVINLGNAISNGPNIGLRGTWCVIDAMNVLLLNEFALTAKALITESSKGLTNPKTTQSIISSVAKSELVTSS